MLRPDTVTMGITIPVMMMMMMMTVIDDDDLRWGKSFYFLFTGIAHSVRIRNF